VWLNLLQRQDQHPWHFDDHLWHRLDIGMYSKKKNNQIEIQKQKQSKCFFFFYLKFEFMRFNWNDFHYG
jgi:hypothetical protein